MSLCRRAHVPRLRQPPASVLPRREANAASDSAAQGSYSPKAFVSSLLGRKRAAIDLPPSQGHCSAENERAISGTLRASNLCYMHPPVEFVELSASASPGRLLYHRSGQRTKNHPKNGFVCLDKQQQSLAQVSEAQVCAVCACASTSPRCVSSTKSQAVFCPSHHYCASMNQAIERSSLFQPASTRSMQNSNAQSVATVTTACVR
jgi:hypothetical protein